MNGSIRVWNLGKRFVTRTIVVGDHVGTMDVRSFLAMLGTVGAFTAGMTDNQLYLVDTQRGTAKAVFRLRALRGDGGSGPADLATAAKHQQGGHTPICDAQLRGAGGQGRDARHCGSGASSHSGCGADAGVVDLGLNSGPHYLTLTSDEDRLVVSDYFLVENIVPSGVINAEGDMKLPRHQRIQ